MKMIQGQNVSIQRKAYIFTIRYKSTNCNRLSPSKLDWANETFFYSIPEMAANSVNLNSNMINDRIERRSKNRTTYSIIENPVLPRSIIIKVKCERCVPMIVFVCVKLEYYEEIGS